MEGICRHAIFMLVVALSTTHASKLCDRKPELIQCIAAKNQFILPDREYCNPFEDSCRTGDLIDQRVATCVPQFTQHVRDAFSSTKYSASESYRCFPTIQSATDMNHRTVGPSTGQPQCVPYMHMIKYGEDIDKPKKGTLVCGDMGTRCVCSAEAERNGVGVWRKNECRCQYFVNLCKIEGICLSSNATCEMKGSDVRCVCSTGHKDCRLGINQCKGNPSLCEDVNKVCIEILDSNNKWNLGNEKDGDGFTCMTSSTVDQLKLTTHYCDVTSATHDGKLVNRPTNSLDECCYRMLTCAGRESFPANGTIFSYRHCYCNIEFRKCLLSLAHNPKYKTAVKEMTKGVENLTDCVIDDGQKCNPTVSDTCSKGDLISPTIAHCKVDCKTGPLLPIWARACSKRQCKPPNHQPYLRVIDIPDRSESSICRPVKKLPVECEKRGTNTRCVCDGKPKDIGFTDRCRCQYWPKTWAKTGLRSSKKKGKN